MSGTQIADYTITPTVGVNTYVDPGQALAFAKMIYPQIPTINALSITSPDAAWNGAVIRACMKIEALDPRMWLGWKTNINSELQWPRIAVPDLRINAWGYSPVYGFGFFYDASLMPQTLQLAQTHEAIYLYLLDSDAGYIATVMMSLKGITDISLQKSSIKTAPVELFGGLFCNPFAWTLLKYLRRVGPSSVKMC